MNDQQTEKPERPVTDGIIALVAVALVVGLILGGVVLFGGKMLGLDGDSASAGEATERQSMSLPPLEKTTGAGGPAITLNTATADPKKRASESSSSSSASSSSTDQQPKKSKKKAVISLQANPLEVGSFEKIALTGTYDEEGAVLQVQRFRSGTWEDFPATVAVSGGTFSTSVQTAEAGVNIFRVIVQSTGAISNEVKVTVNP